MYFANRRSSNRNSSTEKGTSAQYGSIENGTSEKAPLTSSNGRPVMYNARINFTLLDGGSRPLFEEYLEMRELIGVAVEYRSHFMTFTM